jgi:hypothetical protein
MRTIITLKSVNGKVRTTRDHFVMAKRYQGGYELYEGAGTDGGAWLNANGFKSRSEAEEAIEVQLDFAGYDRAYRGKDEASELRRDVQELMEGGFDIAALKAKSAGVKSGSTIYRYSHSEKNPVGVEVMIFKSIGNGPGIGYDAQDDELVRGAGPMRGRPSPGPTLVEPTKTGVVQIGVKKPSKDAELHRRRIVVHNHLPVRKANDADFPVDTLRKHGRDLMQRITESATLRQLIRSEGYTRAEEAFIVEGWKYGRMLAGLSENV